MPFFFPLGIAFMGSQSAVMMKMAGEQWQYGKRRISAMTNEEFNKLTPVKLFEIETSELRAMIPLMQESMRDMNKLTPIIVTEMIKMFEDFVTILYQKIQGETDNFLHPLFNMMLSVLGMPTKNIQEVDFINTLDKFQPPGKPDVPFPTSNPIPKEKLTQKELNKKQITIFDQYLAEDFSKIVGSGKTRTQLIAAQKYAENIAQQMVKKLKQKGLSSNKIAALEKFRDIQFKVAKAYLDAQRFINKHGLNKTP